jgi:MFS family permease
MGIVVLLTTLRPQGAALGTVLVGIGLGAEVDLIAFLLSRYFGMRSFGEIYGYFFSIFILGAGLGPLAMGLSYDRTGSYKLMLVCFAFALSLASLPMLRLGPYAYPTTHKTGRENAMAPDR